MSVCGNGELLSAIIYLSYIYLDVNQTVDAKPVIDKKRRGRNEDDIGEEIVK